MMAIPEWRANMLRQYLDEEYAPALNYAKTPEELDDVQMLIENDLQEQMDELEMEAGAQQDVWDWFLGTYMAPHLQRVGPAELPTVPSPAPAPTRKPSRWASPAARIAFAFLGGAAVGVASWFALDALLPEDMAPIY
jgi:hypothetical protein